MDGYMKENTYVSTDILMVFVLVKCRNIRKQKNIDKNKIGG